MASLGGHRFGMAGLGLIIDLWLLSIAVGTVTLVLTYSHLTKSIRHEILDWPWIGELASCPFCMSFWVAMPASFYLGGNFVPIIFNWLIITGLSCLFIGILLKLFLFREKENEDLRELLRESRETINDLLPMEHTSESSDRNSA